MANQPPTGRPWFRLASQALRGESPSPPQPAPSPQGPPIRQLISQPTAVRPPQPQPTPVQSQPQAPQPPPPPAAPTQPSVTPPQGESTQPAPPSGEPPKQPSSPLPPLRPIKTSPPPPSQSPKVKSPSPTPSPSPRYNSGDRTLQPSPEPELKTIPEAQPKTTTTNSGKGEPYKNARNGEPKLGTSQADTRGPPPPKREAKKKDEGDTRLITIAGENVGAYMDLGPPYSLSSKKQQQQQQQQQQKSNGNLPKQDQVSDSATNDGKSSDKNGAGAAEAAKAKPMTSLVNSNVQSVNNSIIFSSSCTQRSPGVHIALTNHRNPNSKAHPPPQ